MSIEDIEVPKWTGTDELQRKAITELRAGYEWPDDDNRGIMLLGYGLAALSGAFVGAFFTLAWCWLVHVRGI